MEDMGMVIVVNDLCTRQVLNVLSHTLSLSSSGLLYPIFYQPATNVGGVAGCTTNINESTRIDSTEWIDEALNRTCDARM